MFGLIKKEKQSDVTVEEIGEIIDKKTKSETDYIEKKADLIIDDLAAQLLFLKKMLIVLKEKDTENGFANSMKNKYCERCISLFDLKLPDFSYSGMKKYADTAEQIAKTVENPSIKEFRQLTSFKNDMNQISLQTKIIAKKVKELRKVYDEPMLENKENAEKCIDWVFEIRKKLADLENEVNSLKNRERDIYSEILDLKKEAEHNKKGVEDSRLEEINNEITALEKQKNSIKQQIETDFGSINRPLRKLQHLAETKEIKFTKEENETLKEYLNSEETFLISDLNNNIKVILEQLKECMSKNMFSYDEREKDKVMMINRSLDFFVTLKDHYNKLVNQIDEKEKFLHEKFVPFMEKRNNIETEIINKNKETEKIKKEIDSKISEKSRLKLKISNDIDMLENILKKIGISLKIKSDPE